MGFFLLKNLVAEAPALFCTTNTFCILGLLAMQCTIAANSGNQASKKIYENNS